MEEEIIHADCLDYMRSLPDNYFDLIITDPPYGIGEAAGKNKSRSMKALAKDYGNMVWDNERADVKYINEMLRVSKNQVIFGGNDYADLLPASSCWLVWGKNKSNDFADCELAWASFKTAARLFKWTWNGMLQEKMDQKEKRYHPTQKPVPLICWILNNYAKKGDTIFDPFAGSGTTLVACQKLGFDCTVVEKESDYIEIIKKRTQVKEVPLL